MCGERCFLYPHLSSAFQCLLHKVRYQNRLLLLASIGQYARQVVLLGSVLAIRWHTSARSHINTRKTAPFDRVTLENGGVFGVFKCCKRFDWKETFLCARRHATMPFHPLPPTLRERREHFSRVPSSALAHSLSSPSRFLFVLQAITFVLYKHNQWNRLYTPASSAMV